MSGLVQISKRLLSRVPLIKFPDRQGGAKHGSPRSSTSSPSPASASTHSSAPSSTATSAVSQRKASPDTMYYASIFELPARYRMTPMSKAEEEAIRGPYDADQMILWTKTGYFAPGLVVKSFYSNTLVALIDVPAFASALPSDLTEKYKANQRALKEAALAALTQSTQQSTNAAATTTSTSDGVATTAASATTTTSSTSSSTNSTTSSNFVESTQQQQQTSTSSSSTQDDGESLWHYLDAQKNERGPFTFSQISQWIKAGYFGKDLLIRRKEETGFRALGNVLEFLTQFPSYDQGNYESYVAHAHFDQKGRFKVAGILNNNERYGNNLLESKLNFFFFMSCRSRWRKQGLSNDWAHNQLAQHFDVDGYQEALRAKKKKLGDDVSLFENKERWKQNLEATAESASNRKYYEKDESSPFFDRKFKK